MCDSLSKTDRERARDGAHSASLTHSLQTKSLSLSSSSSLSLALSLFLVPSQTKAASVRRTEGALAKLKPDSSCLSKKDHRFLILPSPKTSQPQIQINTLQ